ncbi:hypothetical protein MUN88_17165 [Gracilibacillus caseinilyticus]|uniref:Holin-X, holin superfamily III n=1 Tax=Gracilibacillus caseinilyticus TaxID=2932256 RepID=A0ABY4EV59_9BACI|nr:hypothetical protein [Gracilibacillus caseinilyticus]UOQ47763.1 hypothetical protein MUN88_17165 [Gracilibacillus caseinilyticus]
MKVKELKDAIYKKDNKELINFIRDNFEQNGNIPVSRYRNNLDTLKKIDHDTRNTLVARLSKLEEGYNAWQGLGGIIALIVLFISSYSSFATIIMGETGASLGSFIIAVIVFLLITSKIGDSRLERSTAIYFKQLVTDTHESEKEKKD